MKVNTVNLERLQRAAARLGDAAIDPTIWPEIMEDISVAARAEGAGLLQSDVRTADIPRTAGVDKAFRDYFDQGWHMRDIRAERGVPLVMAGANVVIDQDILTPEEVERTGLYADLLIPNGVKWWASVAFRAGPAMWALSFQRSPRQGPFEISDKPLLGSVAQRLTEAATLSWAVGRATLTGMTNALELVRQPALAIDRFGRVLETNQLVAPFVAGDIAIRDRRLVLRDRRAAAMLDSLIDQLRVTPDTATLTVAPMIAQREGRRPLLLTALPVDGAARTPFLGARVLLLFTDLDLELPPDSAVVARAFGLSPAETRLAMLVGAGTSPRDAAEQLGIARETARSQLKNVFAKTGTHRQAELVALLGRLPKLARGEPST
jgi:DNA-binding CsgD family transcriptional regulator